MSTKYSPYLENLIKSMREDEFLQADLKYPLVQEAIKHWLGIKRLPNDVAEAKFNEDYRVLQTFGKIKNLQEVCAREGAQFPLDLVLKDLPKNLPAPSAPSSEHAVKPDAPRSVVTKAGEVSPPSAPSSPREGAIEGVLKKKKSEPRMINKAASVRFAEPAQEVEVTFPVEPKTYGTVEKILRHPLFSMEPVNVARWWSLQFFAVAVYFAYLTSP